MRGIKMKPVITVIVLALGLAATMAFAQQPSPPPAFVPGHQQPTQGGMCPMMSGGMMGMMGGGLMDNPSDPRMLQMRGEMMKAMGDIMMKYSHAALTLGTRGGTKAIPAQEHDERCNSPEACCATLYPKCAAWDAIHSQKNGQEPPK